MPSRMAAVRRVRGQRWEFAVALLGGLSSALLIAVAEWERLRLDPDALELAEPRRWRQGEREESARTPPTSRPAAPNGAAPNELAVRCQDRIRHLRAAGLALPLVARADDGFDPGTVPPTRLTSW